MSRCINYLTIGKNIHTPKYTPAFSTLIFCLFIGSKTFLRIKEDIFDFALKFIFGRQIKWELLI